MITDHGLITEREERTLRSWLDESPPMLPDRVWSAVMAEVPATRQRRPTVVTHALPDRRWARLLLAAALVTALAGGLIAGVGATGLVRLPGPPHALPRTGSSIRGRTSSTRHSRPGSRSPCRPAGPPPNRRTRWWSWAVMPRWAPR